jgi:hypothetical protein
MVPVVVVKTALSDWFQVAPVQLASVVFQLLVAAPLFQVRSAAWTVVMKAKVAEEIRRKGTSNAACLLPVSEAIMMMEPFGFCWK